MRSLTRRRSRRRGSRNHSDHFEPPSRRGSTITFGEYLAAMYFQPLNVIVISAKIRPTRFQNMAFSLSPARKLFRKKDQKSGHRLLLIVFRAFRVDIVFSLVGSFPSASYLIAFWQ